MKNTNLFPLTVTNTVKFVIIGAFLFAMIGIAKVYAQDKETRNLGSFTMVSLEGAYDILLKEGNSPQIEIVGSEETSPKDIITEVKNGKLSIRLKDEDKNRKWKMNSKNGMPKLILTYQKLESIENSGVVNLKADKVIKCDNFKFSASGAGNFEVDFDVAKLSVDMSGAMNLKVSGKATEQTYNLSGAGSIEAYNLVGDKVIVDMSGAGSAQVHAKNI